MKESNQNILIVGAGLVGSLLAVMLVQKGFKVTVIEKRPDARLHGNIGGRSINLALSNRGWKALKEIGVEEQVKSLAIDMQGRMMHDENGELTFQPYGKEGQAIYSVSRGGLNQLLMNKAEEEGAAIFFDIDCENIDFEKNIVDANNLTLNKKIKYKADLIIGADGAFSVVRDAIMKSGRFNYEQFFLEHGYKELSIEPTSQGEFALDPNALHIWPRGQYMLIALPNSDKSFTCTLFYPFEGEVSFDSLNTKEDVMAFFTNNFKDAIPIMPNLIEDFFNNPTSSLVTVKSYPWVKNKTLLIGDAAHAIVPFYGQGMNAGFEDCTLFGAVIDRCNSWEMSLNEFQKNRKQDADAIADLAIQNFIEMRDKVADDKFLLRKKIEGELNKRYPQEWIPLYSMVTFSDMGYNEARIKGKLQEKIMDQVMAIPNIKNTWETINYQSIIDQLNG